MKSPLKKLVDATVNVLLLAMILGLAVRLFIAVAFG